MNKAPNPSPWYQPWRAARRASDADAADLGTAFGLDMSVEHWENSEPPAVPTRAHRAGWLQRLTAGRKPTV